MAKQVKKTRAQWSEKQLQDGLKLIADGYSQHQAAALSGIPRCTLRNHINTQSTKKELGRKSILTEAQEKDFVARIIRYAETGLPLTPLGVRRVAYQYCDQYKIPHSFNEKKRCAGRAWYRSFLKRNPNLRLRKAQNMNMARAQKLNRFIVNDYFDKLKQVLQRLDLFSQPHRIYNMDEKGCRLTIHQSQKVLAERGAKRVHCIANEHAENVTIVGCVNAIGHVIPPMILFKGKKKKPIYEDNLPPKSIVAMTEKGSMTVTVFNHWLDHFAQFKGSEPVLLILDGAKCHLDLSICMTAEKLGIEIFCLPSNTTHELQPLDKSCYGPFEKYWDDELLSYWTHFPNRSLNKEHFGVVFTPVWNRSMTISNITSGFSATGIYPYAPSKIPDEAFLPSLLTEKPADGDTLGDLNDDVDPDDPDEINIATQVDCTTDSPTVETRLHSSDVGASGSTSNSETPGPNSNSQTPGQCSESSKDDESPPFSNVLPSPCLPESKRKQTKKSVNYKATVLTKNLFHKEETETDPLKDVTNERKKGDKNSDKTTKKRVKNSEMEPMKNSDGEPEKKRKKKMIEEENQAGENEKVQDENEEILATPLLQKGNFVVSKLIYNYGTRKETEKYFVAAVEELKVGRMKDQIKLKFLKKIQRRRMMKTLRTYFTFPSIPDIFSVSQDQILQVVELKEIKRGRYYFENFDSLNVD